MASSAQRSISISGRIMPGGTIPDRQVFSAWDYHIFDGVCDAMLMLLLRARRELLRKKNSSASSWKIVPLACEYSGVGLISQVDLI